MPITIYVPPIVLIKGYKIPVPNCISIDCVVMHVGQSSCRIIDLVVVYTMCI